MQNALYRLVYLSQNRIEGDDRTLLREIEEILRVARRNNSNAAVTGALMFNAGCFAQVLEGPHDSVQDTFERIQCDMRHSNVSILAFGKTEQRTFSHWSMAYMGKETHAANQFIDIARDSGFNPDDLDGERIFELLQQHMEEASHP